jgi:hypothetical protein
MKRVLNVLFVTAVMCGHGAVASEEGRAHADAGPDEASFIVAALGRSIERHAAAEAAPARKAESFLYTMGLAGHGPFPSRGGPLDD